MARAKTNLGKNAYTHRHRNEAEWRRALRIRAMELVVKIHRGTSCRGDMLVYLASHNNASDVLREVEENYHIWHRPLPDVHI